MRTLRVASAVLLIGLAGCSVQQREFIDSLDQPEAEPRPAQQIYVSMDYAAPYIAEAGDTVSVIMEPGFATPGDWCDHRGGTLWLNPWTDILYCEGIDF